MKNEIKEALKQIHFELVAHDTGIVLGFRSSDNTYATWEYSNRSGLYWGHYDLDKMSGWNDFIKRLTRVTA